MAADRRRRRRDRVCALTATNRLRAIFGSRAWIGDGGNASHARAWRACRACGAALRGRGPGLEYDSLVRFEPARTAPTVSSRNARIISSRIAHTISYRGVVPAWRLRRLRGGDLVRVLPATWVAVTHHACGTRPHRSSV